MCHPTLVLPFLQDFDDANVRVGDERHPLKTEVIYYVNDLDAAPPEWSIGDVRSLAKISAVTNGSTTLGVAVGFRQFIADQLFSKADVICATHERAQLCQDPQTEFALLRENLEVSRINHILRVHGHKFLEEQSAAAVYDEIGQLPRTALPWSHGGQHDASNPQCEPIRNRVQESETSQPRLIWEPSTKPRIRGMIRDAVLAGLLPEQLLETRLSEVIETATSTYLRALDNDEPATAQLFIQKAAQAADDSWQHTVSVQQGLNVAGPSNASLGHLRMTTARKWTSQRPGRAVSVQASEARTLLERSLEAGYEN